MDFSDADHSGLKRLLAWLKAGEVEIVMSRKGGERLSQIEHDDLVRHLIYLDYMHARTLPPK